MNGSDSANWQAVAKAIGFTYDDTISDDKNKEIWESKMLTYAHSRTDASTGEKAVFK
jgi:hypothetical protein